MYKHKNNWSYNLGPQTLTSEIFKVEKYQSANHNSIKYIEKNELYKDIRYANCKQDAFSSLHTTEYFNNLKCINNRGTIIALNVENIKIFYHNFELLL